MLFRVPASLILAAAGVLSTAAEESKPACTAATLGQLWPDAANRDPKIRNKMAHCGELELCTRSVWRYHWRSLTVRLDQLRGGSALAKPAGCEAAGEAGRETEHATRSLPTR